MIRSSFAFLFLLVFACAGGDDGSGGDGGGSADGGDDDAGSRRDAGGPPSCEDGQHLCGGGCIDDQPNEPDRGCRLGCGEACPIPEGGTATCTSDGECDFECGAAFVRGPDGCSCDARTCEDLGATCGEHDDGCGGTLTCGTCADGTDCVDGTCGCAPDAAEPNESRIETHDLPDFSDAPDTSMTFDTFDLSDAEDEDWFTFAVSDDLDAGNPQVRVTLDGIPPGSDYDLGVWYVCAEGGEGTTCAAGAPENMIGRGCTSASSGTTSETVELDTNCSGTDDGGTVYVRVTSSTWGGACGPYLLEVDVR